MSVFVQSTAAPAARTRNASIISLFYAGVLTVFAVAQLYTLEDFIVLVQEFQLPFAYGVVYLIAPLLVVFEVFSLPFLLRMRLSPAMRWVSMVFGWLVAVVWLALSVWVALLDYTILNIGFLGTAVELVPGWWAVCLSVALGILAAWSSWGLWPGKRTKK